MPNKKTYSTEELYSKLNGLLEAMGLSYQDIKNEFETKRPKPINTAEFTFAHGRVLPTPAKVTPERIKNGSYAAETPSLKAWFEREFRNSSIYEHLGDYDVVENLQYNPEIQFNHINGNLFLYGDGNHRLFNYLLLAIIDQKASKTGGEVNSSRERFTLHDKPVHFEHPKSLIKTFDNYTEQTFYSLPISVQNFIKSTLYNDDLDVSQADYMSFNPETKNYNLTLNAEEYHDIPAEVATKIINNRLDIPKGLKFWRANNLYYMSVHNRVYKTADREEFTVMAEDAYNNISEDKPLYSNEHLIIYDVDDKNQNNISVLTEPKAINIYENKNISREDIVNFKNRLNAQLKPIINYLTVKSIKSLEEVINSTDNTSIEFPALEFYSLDENSLDDVESFLVQVYNSLIPETEPEQND